MQSIQLTLQGVLLALILVSGWGVLFLMYQIIKQQGRVLLRLDAIEQRLGIRTPVRDWVMPAGLAVSSPFPSFKLPDLAGNAVALEDFRGKKILLVNWRPQCGFCARIASELAQLQPALQEHNVALVFAAYGEEEANRKLADEHALKATFLLQTNDRRIAAFRTLGTPAAYLLDEGGLVVKPLAVGADRVPVLARYSVGAAAETEVSGAGPASQHVCGQSALQQPATPALPGAGPGTELKKLLGRFGIAVTPDCPCNDHAVLMDKNGWAWCEQNLETIVEWMHAEASRRGLLFTKAGARLLAKRAITKARRAETDAQTASNDKLFAEEEAGDGRRQAFSR